MKSDEELSALFDGLWSDVDDGTSFPETRPFLAHYTSMATLEKIFASDEIWFSSPLFMNDYEELRFGMGEGAQLFREHAELREACGGEERYRKLLDAFDYQYEDFINGSVFDIYVLCLSEHIQGDSDGRLSMWRGYGDNGGGAALVLDTSKLEALDDSPIILSKVIYGTTNERLEWIERKLDQLAVLIRNSAVPDEKLYIATHSFLERLKIFALFTKHSGFSEEKEWRAVYIRDRDTNGKYVDMLHYVVGNKGIEPKWKFSFSEKKENIPPLIDLVHKVVLGPSLSGPLAVKAAKRMFEILKKDVADKICFSSTPYRKQ